jgi:hypothetical protein
MVALLADRKSELQMTHAELQAIRARLNSASDGPWSVRRIPNSYDSQAGDRYTHPCVRGFRVPRRLYDLAWQQVEADAEFMASARQDIPNLVAEVEHVRSTLKECREALDELLQRGEPFSVEDLSRVERYLAEEDAQWDGGQKKLGEVRRLYVTQPPLRPKEATGTDGAPAPRPSGQGQPATVSPIRPGLRRVV